MEAESNWRSKFLSLRYWKYIGYGLLIIFFILLPVFVHSPYYLGILITAGINIILAMSFIMTLKTGLISMAISAYYGIGAYAAAMLITKLGISFWLALPASIIIVIIVAFITGLLFVKNAGFGFLIITMAFGMLIPVVLGNTPFVGGYAGISPIAPPSPINIPLLPSIHFVSKIPFYYLILCLLLIVILVFWALYSAWTGPAWRAIGLTDNLAESVGINVFRYRLLAFVIACAVDGLAGAFYASYMGTITPNDFGVFKSIYVQIYAILGGIEYSVLGPLVGSIIMTFVPEFLRVASEVEPVITGCFLIILILLLPKGILGLIPTSRATSTPNRTLSRISHSMRQWLAPKWKEGDRDAPSQKIK